MNGSVSLARTLGKKTLRPNGFEALLIHANQFFPLYVAGFPPNTSVSGVSHCLCSEVSRRLIVASEIAAVSHYLEIPFRRGSASGERILATCARFAETLATKGAPVRKKARTNMTILSNLENLELAPPTNL